jgi:hypothetical protein
MAAAKWKFWSLTAAVVRIVERSLNYLKVQTHTV